MKVVKSVCVLMALSGAASCGNGASNTDGGSSGNDAGTSSGGFALSVTHASACGSELDLTISLQNMAVSTPLNVAPEHFSVTLATHTIVGGTAPPLDSMACQSTFRVASGGTISCDLSFQLLGNAAPATIAYDDGSGHSASAPVDGVSPSSLLAGSSWTSMTVTPEQLSNGVQSSTFTMHFGMPTASGSACGDAVTGPFTGTLTQVYVANASAGSRAGCTETTMFTSATYTDLSTTDQRAANTGGSSLSGEQSFTTRTGCLQPSSNGTDTSPTLYTDNGGIENYTISGSTMTMTGDSVVPFYGSGTTWTFTRN